MIFYGFSDEHPQTEFPFKFPDYSKWHTLLTRRRCTHRSARRRFRRGKCFTTAATDHLVHSRDDSADDPANATASNRPVGRHYNLRHGTSW